MTALARPQTDHRDPLSPVRRRDSERGILSIALGAAIALHLAALALPLPARPAPQPVAPPKRPPIVLTEANLPPPDLPELPPAAAVSTARPMPIPMDEAPDQEPVAEPVRIPLPERRGEFLPEVGDFASPPPPQDHAVIPEGTPGLVLPRLISKCSEPLYPVLAARVGLEGVVVLRALITEQGEVTSIELFEAPRPDLGFSESAITALSCWVYEPGRYQGRAVAVSMTVIVEFEID